MERWRALDRLRAFAVLWMVQGHTFSALLVRDGLPRSVSHLHSLLHGLTAPTFLFGAGLAFGITTYGQYQRHQTWNDTVHRRLRRYMMLILTGYAVQISGGPLAALHASGEQLRLICRVGPLQLIGIVLGLCQLAVLVLPRVRSHALVMFLLALAAILGATPIAHTSLAAQLGLLLGAFFDDRGGAHFPLFPWAAFVLLGVSCAGLLQRRPQWQRALPFIVGGALLSAISYCVYQSAKAAPGDGWLWRTSPSFFSFRMGLVLVLLGLMHVQRTRSQNVATQPAASDGWAALLARHSLVAYVVHLMLLYGTPFTPSFMGFFGKTLNLAQVSLACAAVLLLTLLTVRLWDWLEHKQWTSYGRGSLVVFTLALLVR